MLHEMIHKWVHMFYKLLVSDDPGLFESIYALLNAHVDPALVVYQCGEVVSINISCGIIFNGIRLNSGSVKTLFK